MMETVEEMEVAEMMVVVEMEEMEIVEVFLPQEELRLE